MALGLAGGGLIALLVAHAAEFVGTDYRFWSGGEGTLVLGTTLGTAVDNTDTVEYVYRATDDDTAPATPTGGAGTDDFVPTDWSADAPEPTIALPYVWRSTRTQDGGAWADDDFAEPELFSELGTVYQGRPFITLSRAESSLGQPDRRLTASFPVTDPELRAALLVDPGPLEIVIRSVFSNDRGQSWSVVPNKLVGRLSRPVIKNGVYTIEIETHAGDVDRGRPLKWSDEDQRARYPGDRGLEYMRQLASGINTRWPS